MPGDGLSRPLDSVRFTREAAAALQRASEVARWQGAELIDLPHLVYGAARQPIGFCLLKLAGADPQHLAESLRGSRTAKRPGRIGVTNRTSSAMALAREHVAAWSHPRVTSGHLIIASVAIRADWGRDFGREIGVNARRLRRVAKDFPFIGTDTEALDLITRLLEDGWIDEEERAWLEREQIIFSIQYIPDLRASVSLLMSSANGNGASQHPDLGVSLGGLTGDTFLTLEWYEKAQSVKPEFAESYRMSGALALAQRGRFEAARGIVRSLLQHDPRPGFYVNAAQVESLAGQVDDARTYLVKASSELGRASHVMRQLAEILWHSIDGGFEHALKAIVDTPPTGPYTRLTHGLARIELAKMAGLAGEGAADNQLYEVSTEYDQFGMEGIVLEALVVLAESQQARGDERFDETKQRAVELATRLGRPVRASRLMSS